MSTSHGGGWQLIISVYGYKKWTKLGMNILNEIIILRSLRIDAVARHRPTWFPSSDARWRLGGPLGVIAVVGVYWEARPLFDTWTCHTSERVQSTSIRSGSLGWRKVCWPCRIRFRILSRWLSRFFVGRMSSWKNRQETTATAFHLQRSSWRLRASANTTQKEGMSTTHMG